ncbi:hypothetical protein EUGRSUZ_A01925 [Eucalyptus grandis]|uniref:Uncharacterized protein n=2 Tax=Eucalyptus grandis TaxID=71139 RepID=A0ACC3M4R8_EUCGR|nr:hypothetical protein EUGRSUZ_A01925 [Eucalyptus grandis]
MITLLCSQIKFVTCSWEKRDENLNLVDFDTSAITTGAKDIFHLSRLLLQEMDDLMIRTLINEIVDMCWDLEMVETLHVLQVKDRTGQEVHDLAYGGRGLVILLHGTFFVDRH